MAVNLRNKKIIPRTRNRCRGKYCLNIKITSKSITKDKATKLCDGLGSILRELRLVGVVAVDYNIGGGP